jgi:hypothetical protein
LEQAPHVAAADLVWHISGMSPHHRIKNCH